jgi:hypothetical protein
LKKKRRIKNKGSITIYLSLILVSVILLISIISESGRISAVQGRSKSYTYMAAESVLAGYGKQVFQDYGVLLVWENKPTEEQLKNYIQDNIKMADLSGNWKDFMKTELVNVEINSLDYATEQGGKVFTEQIISYMKYAGTIQAAESLAERFGEYSESADKSSPDNKNDITYIIDDNGDFLQQLVEDINNIITSLKDITNLKEETTEVSQKLEVLKRDLKSDDKNQEDNKSVKTFLKQYRELITKLDKKAGDVDSAITLIKQYEEKKEQFLKENGYTADAGDYIEDNLKILENIGNKIKENKELAVSDFSEINSKHIETIIKSMEIIDEVENNLESLQCNRATEQDKKNQSVYENAAAFLKNEILSLVTEDISEISNNAVSLSNLPSTLNKTKTKLSVLETAKNKAATSLYAKMEFGNYIEPKKNTSLQYELEYIIAGKNNDKDNLIKTIEKIAAVRNTINLAYILTDSEKMSEVSAVATSVTTAIGLPFLEPAIKGVLLEAWSMAESVWEVRELLKGEKIPLVKSGKNWKTSLKELWKTEESHYKGKGIDYETYLEMLIMAENNHKCVFRIMDLIQLNIQKRYQSNFLMSQCFQSIDITATFQAEPLFTAMPWVVRAFSQEQGGYRYEINCVCNY